MLDYEPLEENVMGHAMVGWQEHSDGRGCAYHHRLGKWIWVSSRSSSGQMILVADRECLREHILNDLGKPA